jgi:hypothetical protein
VAADKLFLVVKNDVVVQATTYLVRAHDESHAKECVDSGMYIEETRPEVLDLLESQTVSVEEIKPEGNGQSR